jgi:3-mercaptopyruvate sulfurtransferase SseA
VPYFALRFLAGYPKVKLYNESQREWLQDERELPFWTYDSPQIKRGMHWLQGWNGGMLRAFGLAQLSLIDVRDPNAYGQGHLPYALNLPAEIFKAHLKQPAQLAPLASLLGAAGVNDSHEAVVLSDGGLTPRAALAFLALEQLGQKRVSLLMDSTDDWGLAGFPLTKQPTTVGPRLSPQDLAVPVASYRAQARMGVQATGPAYPKVYIAAGAKAPASLLDGKLIHLPYQQLLNNDGTPKAAKDLLSVLSKAGVPRYAEVVCIADDPGEAAVVYFVLKLIGWPDVKVLPAWS